MLETSAIETLYGDRFTLDKVDKTKLIRLGQRHTGTLCKRASHL